MRKKVIMVFLALIIILSSCSQDKKTGETKENQKVEEKKDITSKENNMEQFDLENGKRIKATIKTNMGEIKLALFPEVAPKAVENFVQHAKDGYYEGVIFHRVIEGFMIQGGDPTGTGSGGESIYGKDFEDEFDIRYRNFKGAISMANAGPNTNGSQFFIVTASKVNPDLINQMVELGEKNGFPEDVVKKYEEIGGTPHLDFRHTVFGQVYEGLEVALKIEKVKTNSSDKPLENVTIEKILIEE